MFALSKLACTLVSHYPSRTLFDQFFLHRYTAPFIRRSQVKQHFFVIVRILIVATTVSIVLLCIYPFAFLVLSATCDWAQSMLADLAAFVESIADISLAYSIEDGRIAITHIVGMNYLHHAFLGLGFMLCYYSLCLLARAATGYMLSIAYRLLLSILTAGMVMEYFILFGPLPMLLVYTLNSIVVWCRNHLERRYPL